MLVRVKAIAPLSMQLQVGSNFHATQFLMLITFIRSFVQARESHKINNSPSQIDCVQQQFY